MVCLLSRFKWATGLLISKSDHGQACSYSSKPGSCCKRRTDILVALQDLAQVYPGLGLMGFNCAVHPELMIEEQKLEADLQACVSCASVAFSKMGQVCIFHIVQSKRSHVFCYIIPYYLIFLMCLDGI